MSSRPIVEPSRSQRAARADLRSTPGARSWVEQHRDRSSVASRVSTVARSWAVISWQIGRAAHLAVGPATDDRREEPRAATAVDDADAVGAELGQRPCPATARACPRRCRARRGPGRRRASWSSSSQRPRSSIPVQPALAEDARVLGRDHDDRVEAQHHLGRGRTCCAAFDGEHLRHDVLGLPRELVDDRTRALAREERDRVLPASKPNSVESGVPGRALLVLGEAEAELARVAEGRRGRPRRGDRRRRCGSRAGARGRWSLFARLPWPKTFLPRVHAQGVRGSDRSR